MIEAIYHEDGRLVKTGTMSYAYKYYIKDHLRNIRVTFADNNNDGLILGTERRSLHDYYAYGMEWNGIWKKNESSGATPYRYGGKEMVSDMNLNQLNFGFRSMDVALGRWINVDALSSSYTAYSGYHYGLNNPIRFVDVLGLGVDTTRVYNTNGQYKFTINDNLPNEDHFLTSSKISDLTSQCCAGINQEGTYARSISEYYIGADARKQLQGITSLSDRLQKEQAFVLTVGTDRQLDVQNITKYANVSSGMVEGMNFAIEKSGINGIVGAGHTHPTGKGEYPAPFPSPAYTFGNSLSDFSPHMYNPYNKGMYGGYLSVVSARTGFTIYTNFAWPNSYTNRPVTEFNREVLLSFNGKTIKKR